MSDALDPAMADLLLRVARQIAEAGDERAQQRREAVADCVSLLGQKLTAYIAGVRSTHVIRAWSEGLDHPDEREDLRIRVAVRVARLIAERDGGDGAQMWFIGRNPHLDDRAPARILREASPSDASSELLSAARAYLIGS